MRDIILNFGQQFQQGITSASNLTAPSAKRIIYCGMGGSVIAGEFLASIDPQIWVHQDYGLPFSVNSDDLVICMSWSGNTEEVISAYQSALEQKANTIVITSGGKLAELAKENGSPLVELPHNENQPRINVGIMAGALWKILGRSDELPSQIDASSMEEQAKNIAEKIGKNIPVIYATYPLRKLAASWKILFNENAKIPAFSNHIPAMVHNEIAGYQSKDQQIHPVLLKTNNDSPEYQRNLQALLAIFDRLGYTYSIANLPEGKPLDQLFNGYVLGLLTSYFLATNLGVNPEDTTLIEEFKKLKA